MNIIKVGSRDSKLAVIQSEIIMDLIKNKYPQYDTQLVTMKTTGDKILDKTLDKIGGKGLFVKELDLSLLNGTTDITVHSLKDMPMEISEELPIIAYSKRGNPFDALVLPENISVLDEKKPIGCAGARRAVQLKKLYPYMEVKPVRGNVQTRLDKLDRGEYSALVLAAAGLERLGLTHRISRLFTPEEMIPAAGQGIIAVQCKKGSKYEFLKEITDKNAQICAAAERTCVKILDGGCSSPIAAFCEVKDNKLYLRGLNVVNDKVVTAELQLDNVDGETAGKLLAERLM